MKHFNLGIIRMLGTYALLCSFISIIQAQTPVKLSDDQSYKFLEGPVWDGEAFLYFTDIPNNTIVRYSVSEQTFTPVITDSKLGNGLMFNKEGNFIICEGETGRVVERKIDGTFVKTLASTWQNKRFNRTNDLCIDKKGGLYFTDPTWSTEYQSEQRVYYIDPNGEIISLITDMQRPNGVLLSTDGKLLYVNDSWSTEVRVYDVLENGAIENKRIFGILETTEGKGVDTGSDGMAIDTEGNLYVTSNAGLQSFDKDGTHLKTVIFPEKTTNCTFGGENMDVLFVTAGKNLYSINTGTVGFRHPFDLP